MYNRVHDIIPRMVWNSKPFFFLHVIHACLFIGTKNSTYELLNKILFLNIWAVKKNSSMYFNLFIDD